MRNRFIGALSAALLGGERGPLTWRGHQQRRTVSMRRFTVALMCTALTLLLAPAAALGYPQDPYAVAVYQTCEGTTEVIVFLHPGAGTALWDITTEAVTSSPNHLIKEVNGEVFKAGVSIGTFHRWFGNKTGQGDPIRCTFTEDFTFPDGDPGQVVAESFHTLK